MFNQPNPSNSSQQDRADLSGLPEFPDSCRKPGVEYRHVPGFLGYIVGSDGSVWSCRTRSHYGRLGNWHLLRQNLAGSGYPTVRLGDGGKGKAFRVHCLVLAIFVGPKPPGLEGCHKDDNKLNNNLSNLRWDTHESNTKDKVANKKHAFGERSSHAKLREQDVMEICREVGAGVSMSEIAERFGISLVTVASIAGGKTWKHLERERPCGARQRHHRPDYVRYDGKPKLSKDDVELVRKLSSEGWSNRAIGRRLKIHHTTVGSILSGKTWKHV